MGMVRNDNYPMGTWGGDPRAPWNREDPECPKCGEEMDPSWEYCPWCGTKVTRYGDEEGGEWE